MVLIHTNNGVFYFDYRFAIAGSIYIPLRWVHNLDNSTYEVSLWKIQKDFAGQNVTNFTDRVPDRFVKIIEDQDAEILESERYFPSIAERWTRKFIDVSDNYIDFENDIRLEYYINTSVPEVNEENFDIFNNGVRQRFKDPAGLTFPLTGGELEIDEWTADTEENHMWFGLTDDAVIFVKYLKL
jgi:succinate dehydrogenase flavin-adding protein (antitoxin of CptAB toxin-antitoxin module)